MSDWGHSTVAYAVHVATEAGARRLALFHHDPSHTDKEIDRMLARARRLGAQYRLDDVTAASEGWTIDLGEGMTTTFNTTQFKEAMSRFATGVTIVTALEDGIPVGFSCQSFVSLSLDPPLVALAPAKTSTSWPRIAQGRHLLRERPLRSSVRCGQNFAVSGGDKFVGVPWHPAETEARRSSGFAGLDRLRAGAGARRRRP